MEYRNMTVDEVVAFLRYPAPTLVLFHARPDGDAVGSAFALAALLRALGSTAWCVCADEVPEHLSFLTAAQQTSVLPENIPMGFENARVVTVDTASPAQLGHLYDLFADRIALMIDHHGVGTPYADGLIYPGAAATGEIVLDVVAAAKVTLTLPLATLLYAAISADTGCFRYSNTTEKTHLSAAKLVATGLDTAEINRQLFEAKSFLQVKAEKAGFDRLHFYENGTVAIITFPYELKISLGVKDEHLGTLIDVARAVRGVEIAVSIRQPEQKGDFRVSLRANCNRDVAAVAAVFGGGGHVRAAGATVHAQDIVEAEKKVLEAILAQKGV